MVISLCSVSCGSSEGTDTSVAEPVDSVGLLVSTIRTCARLYTAEYKVHKIVTHNDVKKLKGTFLQRAFDVSLPLSERRIAIPIDATLKAYIDFSSFSTANVVRRGETIEVILPDPKVELTESHIAHDEIKRYVSLFRSEFTDAELSAYERRGTAALLSRVPQMGIIDAARVNATHVLLPLLVSLGYRAEDVTITFRADFSPSDLRSILDSNVYTYGKE